jgi:hypothetical protein
MRAYLESSVHDSLPKRGCVRRVVLYDAGNQARRGRYTYLLEGKLFFAVVLRISV